MEEPPPPCSLCNNNINSTNKCCKCFVCRKWVGQCCYDITTKVKCHKNCQGLNFKEPITYLCCSDSCLNKYKPELEYCNVCKENPVCSHNPHYGYLMCLHKIPKDNYCCKYICIDCYIEQEKEYGLISCKEHQS